MIGVVIAKYLPSGSYNETVWVVTRIHLTWWTAGLDKPVKLSNDGRNPAPVYIVNISWFTVTVSDTFQVVQAFFHQHYQMMITAEKGIVTTRRLNLFDGNALFTTLGCWFSHSWHGFNHYEKHRCTLSRTRTYPPTWMYHHLTWRMVNQCHRNPFMLMTAFS